MKPSRLSGRKVNDRILRKGKVWKGKTMTVRYMPGAPKHPLISPTTRAVYLGTFASARLDKSAVKRNRMRRRVREAWRLTLQTKQGIGPIQLLVSPTSSSLSCAFDLIVSDTDAFLSHIHA